MTNPDQIEWVLRSYKDNLTELDPEKLRGITINSETQSTPLRTRAVNAAAQNGLGTGKPHEVNLEDLNEASPQVLLSMRGFGEKMVQTLQQIIYEEAAKTR